MTTYTSVSTSAEAFEATSHGGVGEPTGKPVEPLSPGCPVPKAQGRNERYPAWVMFFVNDAISVVVQWRVVDARYKALIASLAAAHCLDGRERRGEGTPIAEGNDDGAVDGTGNSRGLGEYRRHDGRVATE